MPVVKGVACYPISKQARSEWLSRECPRPEPHPAPEVPARPARAEEIPSSARKVIKPAVAVGWDLRMSYARGTAMGANGKPLVVKQSDGTKVPKVVESVMVQGRHGDRRFTAVWEDGSYWIGFVAGGGMVSYRDLKSYIEEAQ